ncbi:MAG: hypothetical protein QG572_1912, partial [Pseudomonadota bacterium]|nr:hypothetical protein [Pseudomonadota bacterium]
MTNWSRLNRMRIAPLPPIAET